MLLCRCIIFLGFSLFTLLHSLIDYLFITYLQLKFFGKDDYMYIYIGIEDLVANAIIELAENNKERKVLLKDLDEYGAMVVKYLNENNEKAMLILSTERTNVFLHDYSNYFETYCDNGVDEGIKLKESVEIADLWDKFRCYLSADVIRAFMDMNALQKLGV